LPSVFRRFRSGLGRAILVVTAAAGLLGAEAAGPQSDQWLCEGVARGSRDAIVIVQFYVGANGTVIAHSAGWRPPTRTRKVGGRGLSSLDVMISYDDASRWGVGAPTSIDASVLSREPLAVLDGSIVVLALPRTIFTGEFDVSASSKGGVAYRSATLAGDSGSRLVGRFGKAGAGRLLVESPTGNPLALVVYDFSARQERDRLFRAAWDKAEQALARSSQCVRTTPDIGPIS
jgi:hypothetical protein